MQEAGETPTLRKPSLLVESDILQFIDRILSEGCVLGDLEELESALTVFACSPKIRS